MVRLKNPSLILKPITEEEKNAFESEFMGDEMIYVLYKKPGSATIHIGMMSSSMQKHFPATANVWGLNEAEASAYFYNGVSALEDMAMQITDRPVYRIEPTDERTVGHYEVLNGTKENGLRVWLDDILDGSYQITPETPTTERKK